MPQSERLPGYLSSHSTACGWETPQRTSPISSALLSGRSCWGLATFSPLLSSLVPTSCPSRPARPQVRQQPRWWMGFVTWAGGEAWREAACAEFAN